MPSNTLTGSYASFAITVDSYTLTNLGTVGSYTVPYGVTVSGAADVLANAGRIAGQVDALYAEQGLSFTNQSGGRIEAQENAGVAIYGAAGGVTNYGTIAGGNQGIELDAGGTVSNQSSGTITALRFEAVGIYGADGTVTNAGKIAAYGTYGPGVELDSGGTVVNLGVENLGTGLISSTLDSGVLIQGGAGTVINAGTIQGGYAGVTLADAGTVINQYGGTIAGAFGVKMSAGGSVTNQYGGVILATADVAIDIAGGTGSVVNDGYIGGNRASVSGIVLEDGGTVTNQLDGGIIGSPIGVEIQSAAGSVSNAGYIYGAYAGVGLFHGGSVTNLAGGAIYSAAYGVRFEGGDGTLTNAGDLKGATDAVRFAAGYANRLIVDPGASFTGAVDGGDAAGAAAVSTLELATGATAGTLSNLGAFTGFAAITIDSGADWTIGGTAGAGTTLVNAGTIAATLTLGAGATLTNTSSGTIGGTSVAIAVKGAAAATVVNAGSIAGTSDGIDLTAGGTVTNQAGATIGATPSGLGIDVAGAAGTVINAGLISGGAVGVNLLDGGTVSNQSTGTISSAATGNFGIAIIGAAATVNNAGTIGGKSDGIYVANALSLTNQSTGTITGAGSFGIYVKYAAGTLTNAGGISGASDGIVLADGGRVTNLSGGTIASGAGGSFGIAINGAVGSVSNTGAISGAVAGILLQKGGTVSNQAGGSIGGADGVTISGAAGTVVNAGTISGSADAVLLGADFANRVAIDPGAAFSGTVSGGNTIGAAVVSTLELAAGTSAGTLAGFGSQFIDFASVAIDSGATWTLTSGSTIAAAVTLAATATLSNAASITNAINGLLLSAGGVVTNQSSGSIGGGSVGIAVDGGAATVTNSGAISGATDGIYASTGLYLTNQSGGRIAGTASFGVYAKYAAGFVTNAGTITGGSDGIVLAHGGTISNQSGGTIGSGAGGSFGIALANVAGTVSNAGTISGTTDGIYAKQGLYLTNLGTGTIIGAGGFGVYVRGGIGTVTNAGGITGASDGILLAHGGSVTNQAGGTIGGGSFGIVIAGTAGMVSNSGAVAGVVAGVRLLEGGYIGNQGGTISGAQGVAIYGVAGTVGNAGNIAGSSTGVGLNPGGSVTNQSGGTISGGAIGITSNGGAATVVNAGLVTASGGTGIELNAGGAVTNQSGGTITGGDAWGAAFSPGGTLINAGLISGNQDGALFNSPSDTSQTGGVVTNQAGGTIAGGDASGIRFQKVAATVVNAGHISGYENGIFLSDGGTITNASGGTITETGVVGGANNLTGGAVAALYEPVTVVNAGDIYGPLPGIYLGDGGTVINQTGGTISSGNKPGIVFTTAGSDTVVNAGIIAAPLLGIQFENGALTNQSTGTIVATATVTGQLGIGVNVGIGTLDNAGSIAGGDADVVIGDSGGRLINESSGTISQSGGTVTSHDGASYGGVILESPLSSATNFGVISGRYFGVSVADRSTVTNQRSGTIYSTDPYLSAGAYNGVGAGVYIANGGTVINAGTIGGTVYAVQAGAHRAVDLGETVLVVADPGAVFNGIVDGDGAGIGPLPSTLELASGASAGTLSGLGTKYIGFNDITIDSGAVWTVSGSLGGAYTITDSGTLTNTGALGSTVTLGAGGVLINEAGATLGGSGVAIAVATNGTGAATVVNAGVITGTTTGVLLGAGGTLINDSGATVSQSGGTLSGFSYSGVEAQGGSATVLNAGSIVGEYNGVALASGGTIANLAGATIDSVRGIGVNLSNATLINAGQISGATYAVRFGAGFNGRLVIDPGAAFSGTVDGGNTIGSTAVSTLELASGASAGTLAGIGSQYINFAAIAIDSGAAWTVTGPGSLATAVTLASDATLTNSATLGGTAVATGLDVTGAGATVINAGWIGGATIGVSGSLGLDLTNQSSGTISGAARYGVYVSGAAGTVVNAGRIDGRFRGVFLAAGGTVTNESGGTLNASLGNAVRVVAAAGTVVNAGAIYGEQYGVYLGAGGAVTNLAGGTIADFLSAGVAVHGGAGTVDNAGSIASADGDGVNLFAGGSVTNQAGATIVGTARYGVYVSGAAGTVVNAGSIHGQLRGVYLTAGGAVTNQYGGTISDSPSGDFDVLIQGGIGTVVNAGVLEGPVYGVGLADGGTVTNLSGGTIAALLLTSDAGIDGELTGNTIDNAGLIVGHFDGVRLGQDSTVINRSGGTIAGVANYGVRISSGTVTNAGTISGVAGAVSFEAGQVNRLIVDPGAVFSGTVDGGNAIGAAVVSTLELASGAGTGTLSGLGTQFVDFSQVTVDSLATWDVAGAIGTGITLSNAGSIDATVTLGAGAVLANLAGGTIGGTAVVAGVTVIGAAPVLNAGYISGGTDGIDLAAAGTVINQSSGTIFGNFGVRAEGVAGSVTNAGTIIGATDAVLFAAGFANRLVLEPGAAFSGTVDGGNTLGAAAVSTLELASGASVGTLTGLGTQFVDFADVAVDSGATWDIASTIGAGITLSNAGSLADQVALGSGGTLTNVSGGRIGGVALASAVAGIGPGPATVVNAGVISGTHYGVTLGAGGIVNNLFGGTISGTATDGVGISGGPGTVVNAGFIAGGTDAVSLAAGFANRAIFDPGATFSGTVDGGNTIGAAAASTLELASGASTGVLSSLGTQFVDFSNVAIDSGAAWSIDSAIGAGITLTNSGHVGTTVTLDAGAVLTNTSGGLIGGGGTPFAVYGATGGPATVVNAGSLSGASTGIFASAGGFATNQSTGFIIGGPLTGGEGGHSGTGVWITGGAGTVVNAGTIDGLTNSVRFAAGYSNLLVVDPNAAFSGVVEGGNAIGGGAVSTLELAAGASAGVLSGIGSKYLDFAAITIAGGAAWSLTGSNDFASGVTLTDAGDLTAANLLGGAAATIEAGATLDVQGAVSAGETIAFDGATGLLTLGSPEAMDGAVGGFGAGDTIDLAGVDPNSVTLSGGVLHFTAGGTPGSFDLTAGGGTIAAVTDHNGGALVTALCFCAGTRIMTPSGEVAIEDLCIGDLVLTASGAAQPLVWIGTGQVMVARGHRSAATPVIVRKNALAQNVPNRDLRVTKGHSLLLDGVLIPVEFLVNHRTILWDDHAQEVTIYHLELAAHDVLLANGAPAESYRDDGNRWLFRNANTGWGQPDKLPCAPVLTGGPVVDAAWRRLLDRADERPGSPLTEDADLHLLVNGARVNPTLRSGHHYVFSRVPTDCEIRVVSRAGSPAELALARDPRTLGVAIRQIRLWQGVRLHVLDAADPALCDGFHDYEADNGFRWTDGDARLPAALFSGLDGACDLELLVDGTARYPLLAAAA